MSFMTKEEFYDSEIAPVLAELAKKCAKEGMPFLACVGNGDDFYTTRFLVSEGKTAPIPAVRMANYALLPKGNIDAFLLAMEKDFDKFGGRDGSMYFWQLDHYKRIIRGEEKSG
jgi:hypothetical protein